MADEKRRKPKTGKSAARPKLTVDALLDKDVLMSTLADASDRLQDAQDVAVVIMRKDGSFITISSCDDDLQTVGLLFSGQQTVGEHNAE